MKTIRISTPRPVGTAAEQATIAALNQIAFLLGRILEGVAGSNVYANTKVEHSDPAATSAP